MMAAPTYEEAHTPPTKMEQLAYALLKILEEYKDRGSADALAIESKAYEKVFGEQWDKERERRIY